MNPDWLEEIEARQAAASPGPWRAVENAQRTPGWMTSVWMVRGPKRTDHYDYPFIEADAVAIVSARDDIARLIARVRELEAVL